MGDWIAQRRSEAITELKGADLKPDFHGPSEEGVFGRAIDAQYSGPDLDSLVPESRRSPRTNLNFGRQ